MSNTGRRKVLKNIATGGAALGISGLLPPGLFAASPATTSVHATATSPLKGNIRHSVCRWCFSSLSLDELCRAAKDIGIQAIDLVGPSEWPVLQKYGLEASMCNGAEINLRHGWNDPAFHTALISNYSAMIPRVAAAGYKNLICFSGNTRGKSAEEGLENCVQGLKQVLPLAEKHGVTLVMELLNSRVDHKDYQCDNSGWGVALCERLGSEHFKLLYDIYHMQIDEGNVIATIRKYHPYFAHYHTAGVPGRNELNEDQELQYPAIMRAIHSTGFKGYVAQEFIPKASDKLESLRQAVQICDI